jgi:mono/diheme cytochrome c family protein
VRLKERGAGSTGLLLLLFLGCVLSRQMALAQAASSTRDGVYTAEQADQGKVIYEKQCASCHQDTLEGKGKNAPLIGDAFLSKWKDQTMADLFMKTNTTMPAASPGSLTPDETARVLAYILQMNKFEPGKKELPTDPDGLAAIQISKP